MQSDVIAILREYIFEYSYDISAIIGHRKYTHIGLDFEGYTM
jgi:hypothetical protein